MSWERKKAPTRAEVNPPVSKRDKAEFKKFLSERDWTDNKPNSYDLSSVPTEQLQAELDKRKPKEQSKLVPLGPPLRKLKWWEGW